MYRAKIYVELITEISNLFTYIHRTIFWLACLGDQLLCTYAGCSKFKIIQRQSFNLSLKSSNFSVHEQRPWYFTDTYMNHKLPIRAVLTPKPTMCKSDADSEFWTPGPISYAVFLCHWSHNNQYNVHMGRSQPTETTSTACHSVLCNLLMACWWSLDPLTDHIYASAVYCTCIYYIF